MASLFHVSLQDTEKKLIEWIKERQLNNELSPSLVFRDAMLEKKRDWDAIHSQNPTILHKRIDDLKKTLTTNSQEFNDFIDSEGLTEKWIDSHSNNKTKSRSRKKQKGGVTEIFEKNPEKLEATQ